MAKPSAAPKSKAKAPPPATAKKEKAAPVKVPLGLRIKAWWEGYSAAQLQAALREKMGQPPPPAPIKVAPAVRAQENELPIDPWNNERIDVAQLIWGAEFCGPGGPDHVIANSKLLTLTPEMSMIDLGAGLGGPARVLAEHFGVWVTGYEMSAALVESGNAMSLMAGKARKAQILPFDKDAEQHFDRRFDRALATHFFSKITEKGRVIEKVAAALKPDSLILVNDYFGTDQQALQEPAMVTWMARENQPLHLTTGAAFVDQLNWAGLHVRVNEDVSEEYSEMVNAAWKNADKVVAKLMAGPEMHLAATVLKEAEIWTTRMNMLRSKRIEVRRILAAKLDPKL